MPSVFLPISNDAAAVRPIGRRPWWLAAALLITTIPTLAIAQTTDQAPPAPPASTVSTNAAAMQPPEDLQFMPRTDTNTGGSRDTEPPWSRAVDDAVQARALWYLHQGLSKHKQLLFADAAALYQRGLKHWDHPKLHYYRGLALAKLGQHLAAYESLSRALSGPRQALDADERAFAQRTAQDLMAGELAAVTVRCATAGAAVSINGKPWFVGPGIQRKIVSPGSYSVEVSKADHVPVTRLTTVRGGESALIEPQLVHNRDAVHVQRRWSRPLPWLVTGAGLLAITAGTGLFALSSHHADEGRAMLASDCSSNGPCAQNRGLHRFERAAQEREFSIGLLAAGGGVLLVGAGMHYLNRARYQDNEEAGGSRMELVPLVGDSAAGAALTIDF